jgi:uncharacterized membrane protein
MNLLVLGLLIFLAAHAISIVAENWRDGMVEKLGEWGWKGLYSVVAIVGFVLLVKGYAAARQDPVVLYSSPTWLRHGAQLLLIPVFPIFLSAYLPGRIKSAVGHPMLVATGIWAIAHLLTNGTLADVLLFGSFLVWAVADYRSMGRRAQRTIPGAPASAANDIIAVVVGLGLYVGFVGWLHIWLIRVPAL